ncbi:hypothetical protein BDY19DRAFT_616340 [Irpex rosettiformis]|uniref:Uncharacterized protein n=1 Tax=Irpex rosettiformis TaxID=378272 RepID=A0ACB8TP66_9APHY|nr:hypothetical protein BDY19DRAFT_616340 [Irpex rosettiformis]
MGQFWMLLNVSNLWVSGGGAKLGEFFCSEGLPVHIRRFTIPAWSEESKTSLCVKYPQITHRSASPESKLFCLPDELLLMIFNYVNILADAACLCLADGRMFAVGFPRVIELQAAAYANWAGCCVVCIGEYAEDNDLPKYVQKLFEHHRKMLCEEDTNPPDEQAVWYDTYNRHFQRVTSGGLTGHHFPRGLEMMETEPSKGFGQLWAPYTEMMKPKYESPHPWVLCNLSKGEYVRVDAVAALTNYNGHKPFIAGDIDLGHALLSQICWSTDDSIAMGYEGDLHRGRWAGDRFVVLPMNKLDTRKTWQDVSDEVTKILVKIWECEWGEDWKELIG